MNATPGNSRARYQFSLRSLLLMVTVCAVVFAAARLHLAIGIWAAGNVYLVVRATRGLPERRTIYRYYLASLILFLGLLVFIL